MWERECVCASVSGRVECGEMDHVYTHDRPTGPGGAEAEAC